MKIAWVLAGGLHPSGREEMTPALFHLLQRLAQQHAVHAFTLRHLSQPTSYRLQGVQVHDLGRPGDGAAFRRWGELRALLKAIARHGPFDLLHGFQADPGVLAALAARRLRVPSIVTCASGEFVDIADIDYGMQRSLRARLLVATACRLATRVHVSTRFMQSLAEQRGYRVERIPIGVDVTAFAAGTRVDGPPWKLLNVASLNRVKDHTTLLEAVAIAARDVDIRLDVVGEDTLDGAMQRYARELQIADRVAFHGYLPNAELPPLYQAAHLYVHSARHEAAAVVFLEAAASGLPIVSTRVAYAADWAPDGAVAVPPRDARALARAIVGTLRDAPLRARLAATARAFTQQHDVDWTARERGALYGWLGAGPVAESAR